MINVSIKCLTSKKLNSGKYYGHFLIDQLKSGQGITIGNQLRRVLLNDIGGIAISGIRVKDKTHEFSTLPGVREDILEILLNLKGVICKSTIENSQFGRLKIQGPAIITAGLIEVPSNLQIINPNHYIATIFTSDVIEFKFKFEYGIGYKLITQNFLNEMNNYLQLDAIFMPIHKVNFKITNIYDNQNNPLERLFIEIWTNGSITPNKALKKAIKIIINLFSSLVKNITPSLQINTQSNNIELNSIESNSIELNNIELNNIKSNNIESYNNLSIEELQLSTRVYNCLKKAQINTVGDLLKHSPETIQKFKNFGKKSADEIFSTLKNKFGIILK